MTQSSAEIIVIGDFKTLVAFQLQNKATVKMVNLI